MQTNTYATTVGMDLGNTAHTICALNTDGAVDHITTIENNREGINEYFSRYDDPGSVLVVVETGTHSPWISHHLQRQGYRVLVGNARKLRVIWCQKNKTDVRDAEMLARIGRFDQVLLAPIKHRNQQAHRDLALLKARDMLVRTRAKLVNHVRGTLKTFGHQVRSCSTSSFANQLRGTLPGELQHALEPILDTLAEITSRIRAYDRQIEQVSQDRYPETARLRQVAGVGPVTALAYVLTLERADRFRKSRDVGPYLGLTPRRDQSGETDRQLRITKAGNGYMRRLLVGAAHYILGPFGSDCSLRRYGERIAARGGRIAKRKAVVAVARKLAVLLHRLWVSGQEYKPLGRCRPSDAAA